MKTSETACFKLEVRSYNIHFGWPNWINEGTPKKYIMFTRSNGLGTNKIQIEVGSNI